MASEPHTTASPTPRARRTQTGEDGRRLGTAGHALIVSALALAFGALLSAPGLHKSATNLQPGVERDAALAVTGPLAGVSGALQLDRPRHLVKSALGRGDDDEIDTAVVIPVATTPQAKPAVTPAPTQPKAPAKVAFTPKKKLRIWIAGDSLVITPGYSILRATLATPVIQSVGGVDGRVATGLERPDVFNWFKEIATEVKKLKPDVVVLHFGGNDDHGYMTGLPKGVSIDGFGTASWRKEYGRRVGGVMDTVARAGGHTIWLGLPITRSPSQTQRFDVINAVAVKEAKKRPATATYIDTYTTFAGDDGGFAEYLQDRRGRTVKVRAGDGVHFERAGGDMIARMVLKQLNEMYDLTSWRTQPR
jgi:hypothetical protein